MHGNGDCHDSTLGDTHASLRDSRCLQRIAAPVPGEGDWPMPAHDYASTRFSPLDEIKPANIAKLQLAFSLSTGIEKGHEAAPIVVGDTMYIALPYPNYLLALDLTRPGANVNGSSIRRPMRARRGSPAAMSSIAARRTPTAASSSTRSTMTRSRSTLRPARDCGARARRHRARRDDHDGASRRQGQGAGRQQRRRARRARLADRARCGTGQQCWRAYSTGPDKDVLLGRRSSRSTHRTAARISA
jgi:hypothetical protein